MVYLPFQLPDNAISQSKSICKRHPEICSFPLCSFTAYWTKNSCLLYTSCYNLRNLQSLFLHLFKHITTHNAKNLQALTGYQRITFCICLLYTSSVLMTIFLRIMTSPLASASGSLTKTLQITALLCSRHMTSFLPYFKAFPAIISSQRTVWAL